MGVYKYNAEGYPDPTAYEAITKVLKEEKQTDAPNRMFMPKVFICSPFAGDTARNTTNAVRYCAFAMSVGYIPFAPHLFFPQFMDDGDPEQRELGLFMGGVFLDDCREVWVFGDTISPGMEREIARARKRGLPTRYFNDRCEEVIRYA
jgi:hypothetical protein